MSGIKLDPAMVATVKEFVEILKNQPALIFSPELKFLRDYLTAVGAKIPVVPPGAGFSSNGAGDTPKKEPQSQPEPPKVEEVEEMEEDEPEEPFPELPQDGVIAEDEPDASQEMGSDSMPSDDDFEKSNELKSEAVGLFNEGKYEECIGKYTEAIKLNGSTAVMFAKRGQAYLKLNKPNACIKDCSKALELNPDSAIAYKYRGRAHRLLGHWEEAAKDLRQACKIDYDDDASEWLKEVQPNARKIEEWRVRKKQKDEEKEIKIKKARARERAKAHSQAQQESGGSSFADDLGGGGGAGFKDIFNDPEISELFSDPEVAAAFEDIGKNPTNLLKYQNNPKVAKLTQILQKKLGGMGGFPGMGGGMPGFGGAGGMPGFGGAGGMPGFPGTGGMPDFGGTGEDNSEPKPHPTPKPPADDLD